MEILKGFVFDLQRHGWTDASGTASTVSNLALKELPTSNADNSTTESTTVYLKSGGGLTKDEVAGKAVGTLVKSGGKYTLTLNGTTADNKVTTVSAKDMTGSVTVKNSTASALTITDEAASTPNAAELAANYTAGVTFDSTLKVTGLAANSGLKIKTGSVKLTLGTTSETSIGYGTNKTLKVTGAAIDDGLTVEADGDVTSFASNKKFKFVTTEARSIQSANVAWSLKGTASITQNTDTVTDLADKSTLEGAAEESVTTAGAGTFTINGSTITVTGGAVTFTTNNNTSNGVKAVTGLANNGSISGLTAAATVEVGTGTYTVNGVKFTSSGSYTVAPDEVESPKQITLGNFGKNEKITLDSTNEGIIVTDGTSIFSAVTGAVSITGGTDKASTTATLGAGGQSVTVNDKAVTLNSSGTVYVAGDGALTDLGLGENVTIGNFTISVSKNTAGKTIITQVDKTNATAPATTVYQFQPGVTSIGIDDVGDFNGLSGEQDDVTIYKPDDVYTALSNGGDAILSATLENTGTQVFASTNSSTGTEYARLYRTDANTYTFSFNSNISGFSNGVTIDASALPSSATLTVRPVSSPDTTYYKTANGKIRVNATDVGATKTFSITGDVVDVSSADVKAFEITSGYVKLSDASAAATAITTSVGTFNVTEATNDTPTQITSAGVFTNVDAGGIVALQANRDAAEGAVSTFSVNGKAYTAVSETGATITLSASSVPFLSAGSLVIDNTTVDVGNLTPTTSVKVSGGDGVVYNATTGLISDIENGETVTVINTNNANGNQGAPYKTVYTVTNGVLEVAQYYQTTSTKPETQHYYTLTGDAISATGVTPTTGEYENTTTYTATFGTTGNTSTTQDVSEGKALYIQKDGSTAMANDSKTVGTLSVTGDTATYEAAASAKGQTITVGSNANNNAVNWAVTGTGNADVITYSSSSDATINAGSGKDVITLDGVSRTSEVSLNAGDGNNTINLTGSGSYTVVMGSGKNTIDASGAGEYSITTGSGGSKIDRTGGTAVNGNATIVGGTGKDSIKAAGADDVVSGGDGEDDFDVTTTSITINDYAYGSDVLVASAAGTAPAITATNFGADGVVTVGAVQADVSAGTGTGEFYAVSLVDGDGKNKKNVAWAKEGGSTIDITTYDQAVTLIGDDDGKNALYAGTKADTIYSYADSDSVYGGAGKDSISLKASGSGRVVGVATTSSKDTVSGFTASFEEGDSIYMVDGSASDVKVSFANNTVTFKDGEGSLQLNNVATSSTTGAVELNVHGTKMALTGTNGVIATDSTSYADLLRGR